MMKKLLILAVAAGLLVVAPQAWATSGIWTTFQNQYGPCPDLEALNCTICHTATFALNPYGQDLADELAGGGTTAEALVAIELLDSDGDLRDNEQEIGYDCTAPGDPADFGPVPGDEATWSGIQALFK